MIVAKQITNLIAICILATVKFYSLCISPLIGSNCRFYPTCSSFFAEAIYEHGVYRGCLLGVKRIIRCNPWCEGGVDMVPSPYISCCKQVSRKHYILADKRDHSHTAVYK